MRGEDRETGGVEGRGKKCKRKTERGEKTPQEKTKCGRGWKKKRVDEGKEGKAKEKGREEDRGEACMAEDERRIMLEEVGKEERPGSSSCRLRRCCSSRPPAHASAGKFGRKAQWLCLVGVISPCFFFCVCVLVFSACSEADDITVCYFGCVVLCLCCSEWLCVCVCLCVGVCLCV